jgi:hypothetical protein
LLFGGVFALTYVLSRIGHDASDALGDYSFTRFLDPAKLGKDSEGILLVQKEISRLDEAAHAFVEIARMGKSAASANGTARSSNRVTVQQV